MPIFAMYLSSNKFWKKENGVHAKAFFYDFKMGKKSRRMPSPYNYPRAINLHLMPLYLDGLQTFGRGHYFLLF